ncbi:MAG: hypothetical protein V4773_06190, partial [Verrucomicrobiota bacterium]
MSQHELNSHDADRIERAIDGLLPQEELDTLKSEIVRDPVLRAAYVDRVWIDSLLRADRERLAPLLAPSESAPAVQPSRWPVMVSLFAAAAACGALAF